jgi:hypothetical protein
MKKQIQKGRYEIEIRNGIVVLKKEGIKSIKKKTMILVEGDQISKDGYKVKVKGMGKGVQFGRKYKYTV